MSVQPVSPATSGGKRDPWKITRDGMLYSEGSATRWLITEANSSHHMFGAANGTARNPPKGRYKNRHYWTKELVSGVCRRYYHSRLRDSQFPLHLQHLPARGARRRHALHTRRSTPKRNPGENMFRIVSLHVAVPAKWNLSRWSDMDIPFAQLLEELI